MPFNFKKYKEIQDFINKAAKNREKTTKIIAITKNQQVGVIKEALNCGLRIFGENKVQEAKNKFSLFKNQFSNIELHLTGPLQTNKVKKALDLFEVLQTIDREKLAIEINKHNDPSKMKKFFIQVNIGIEKQKSGILPDQTKEFVNFCRKDLKMNIIGLMCIPPMNENPNIYFAKLKTMAKENSLIYLSMGMSSDYENAVLNGSTFLRIGTEIFGERNT